MNWRWEPLSDSRASSGLQRSAWNTNLATLGKIGPWLGHVPVSKEPVGRVARCSDEQRSLRSQWVHEKCSCLDCSSRSASAGRAWNETEHTPYSASDPGEPPLMNVGVLRIPPRVGITGVPLSPACCRMVLQWVVC